MKTKLILSFLFVIALTSFVSAEGNQAICGNGQCEAGFNLGGYQEDILSCYTDCQNTDSIQCEVDSISGGECNFRGRILEFTNLERAGCGIDYGLSFNVDYNGHSKEMKGLIPYNYVPLFDDMRVAVAGWPCAVATTKQTFYLMGAIDPNLFNDFMTIKTQNINLKEVISEYKIIFSFDFHGFPNNPWLDLKIQSSDGTPVIGGQINGLTSNEQIIYIYPGSYNPGKYLVTAKLFDNTGQHILSTQNSNLIMNECAINEECSDGKFWTKDSCSGKDYKICSNPLNYLLIGSIVAVILIILILIFVVFKKRK